MEHKYPRVFDDGSHLWAAYECGSVMFACGKRDGGFEHEVSMCSLQHLVDDCVNDDMIELEELG